MATRLRIWALPDSPMVLCFYLFFFPPPRWDSCTDAAITQLEGWTPCSVQAVNLQEGNPGT